LRVSKIPLVEHHMYLAPGASELQRCACDGGLPERQPGCVRVVCISDTHNEHDGLRLPPGDVLLHTGDVLTESGIRRSARAKENHSDDVGVALLRRFAAWFGQLRYAHKVLIGGNHDSTLQFVGKAMVQSILTEHCSFGEVVYLEDEEATVGRLRIYGSPFAAYSSHNNAFFRAKPSLKLRKGVHVVATHMPAVLPSGGRGELKQHQEITEPALNAGARLHVSGHCHWANGLYFARRAAVGGAWPCPESEVDKKEERLPCVVASVAGKWKEGAQLASSTGVRGDARDAHFGGYNLTQPGTVCDVFVGEATEAMPAPEQLVPTPGRMEPAPEQCAPPVVDTPSLLFFCPPTDGELATLLMPQLQQHFHVVHVETAEDGVRAVSERKFAVCLAKLGSKGNLGRDVIAALRSAQGNDPQVIVHSSTAERDMRLQEKWRAEFGVDLFTCHGREEELIQRFSTLGTPPASTTSPLPRVLVFSPNDPGFVEDLRPRLPGHIVEVDVVNSAEDGANVARERAYCACVVKLGTRGNLGKDVLKALRSAEAARGGARAFAAVHSATAAERPETRTKFEVEYGVELFVRHGEEDQLAAALLHTAMV